jgi:penicillin amidase
VLRHSCFRPFIAPLAAVLVSGCALFTPVPEETTVADRLAMMPAEGLALERAVTIRWDDHQIPFIEAETDGDAAYALGLVHAHLRLAQMEILKRISQGRLSEMAGPLTTEIDAALRALGFGRATPEILAAMPAESRAWLDRYVAGVNAYKAHAEAAGQLPHEFAVLALENEPWTAEDTITLGRLTGTDVNWIVLFGLLPHTDDPAFEGVLRFIVDAGRGAPPDAPAERVAASRPDGPPQRFAALQRAAALTAGFGRTGSNSIVIGSQRSASGAPLIANDPHLGFNIPNAWVIAGLKSPGHHIVGMSVPGVPVFGFGRTPHLAWGGTNMRSLNSDLVDVSGLPADAFRWEEHAIGVRFWFDATARNRISPYGPVISDADDIVPAGGRAFALRWIGHDPSDEITALLGAMRARSLDEFRAAMAPFAVPAQNFLVADRAGRIGHLLATRLPDRPDAARYDPIVIPPSRADALWSSLLRPGRLPAEIDPPRGYLLSANNRPFDGGPLVGRFFSPPERIARLRALVAQAEAPLTLSDLGRWQRDVTAPLSLAARDALLARAGTVADPVLELLAAWDGRYETDSRGAAVFQAFIAGFAEAAYPNGPAAYAARRGYARPMLIRDAAQMAEAEWTAALTAGLEAASPVLAAGTVWGDLHRMEVQHVLGNLPLLGGRYRYRDIPIPGGRETVFKTSHPLTAERHTTPFGSQSRHLSDLADPDANFFVLYGGQDGWINSTTALDQIDLWLEGRAVQVPLDPDSPAARFPFVTRLSP